MSSAARERNFSSTRRIKNWTRTSIRYSNGSLIYFEYREDVANNTKTESMLDNKYSTKTVLK